MLLTLDDIVTQPLATELRGIVLAQDCRCEACMARRQRRTDALLDEWLERTRGEG